MKLYRLFVDVRRYFDCFKRGIKLLWNYSQQATSETTQTETILFVRTIYFNGDPHISINIFHTYVRPLFLPQARLLTHWYYAHALALNSSLGWSLLRINIKPVQSSPCSFLAVWMAWNWYFWLWLVCSIVQSAADLICCSTCWSFVQRIHSNADGRRNRAGAAAVSTDISTTNSFCVIPLRLLKYIVIVV